MSLTLRKKSLIVDKVMAIEKLFIEAFIVGVCLVIMSLIVSYVMEYAAKGKVVWVPPHFKGMVYGTFISGALLHIFFELMRVNAYYVKQYQPFFDD